MDVGGAAFATTKQIFRHHDTTAPPAKEIEQQETIQLVAKGKSYLSYFYVGVCSSVLYLAPSSNDNDGVLFQNNKIDNEQCEGSTTTNDEPTAQPIALEIYYHKPARAMDLQWATNAFIEKNLPTHTPTIADLPTKIQQQLSQFNNLYKNVQTGDRYSLQYIPGNGISLLLNDELLGMAGNDLSLQEEQEFARLIYSVWFGSEVPFSESMKKELLTPLEPAVVERIPSHSSSKRRLTYCATENAALAKNNGGAALKRSNTASILATSSAKKQSSDTMTEEEIKLLESLGILELLKDSSSSSSSSHEQVAPDSGNAFTNKLSNLNNNIDATHSTPSDTPSSKYTPSLSRIRHFMLPPKNITTTLPQLENKSYEDINTSASDAESSTTTTSTIKTYNNPEKNHDYINDQEEYKYNPILLGIGGTLFLLPHLAVLLSLPPVLRGRGAPYLPTFGNKLNTMFDLIRSHAMHRSAKKYSTMPKHTQQQSQLRFVDLGSGDGRVVFRAAREGIFHKSVGYEINPALHLFANLRKIITPRYWSTTNFYMRDLWKIQLHQYDVVAVYGLAPIMKRLGQKLEEELKPGSIVVSNVFEIPGWRASTKKIGTGDGGDGENKEMMRGSGEGVYLYRVPECFGQGKR
ncbi:hypothetical protein ACHAXR_007417 [Thalassiosira sp. AJA248-18]